MVKNLSKMREKMQYLKTHCKPLDQLLGGGIEKGSITKIFGEAGSGKTNFCLQALRECAKNESKIAYIDTEGVSIERLRQLCIPGYDYKKILNQVLFFDPDSLENQEATINDALKLDCVGLLIIDTMNFFYRITLEFDKEAAMRSYLRQMANLQISARKKKIPIIVVEQVYTDKNGEFKPFTHRDTEHMVKTSVRFDKISPGKRKAIIIKHRSQPEANTTDFNITSTGLM